MVHMKKLGSSCGERDASPGGGPNRSILAGTLVMFVEGARHVEFARHPSGSDFYHHHQITQQMKSK